MGAGRIRLGLVLLTIAGFDSKPSSVNAPRRHRLLMDVPRTVSIPAVEGEKHCLRRPFPEHHAGADFFAGRFDGPLQPRDLSMAALEAIIARVVALPLATHRHGVRQMAFLQQFEYRSTIETTVERYALDFQLFFLDLSEETRDDFV